MQARVDRTIDLEDKADKDASGGYVGKTLEKINIFNAARTYLNQIVAAATTAIRTWTFPDKDITVAGTVDISDHASAADPHTVYIKHSLATAANDFLVASEAGAFIKKALAEVKTILGLGSAAYTALTDYVTHALATAENDFLVASGAGVFVKKTLAETKTILGISGPFDPTVISQFYDDFIGVLISTYVYSDKLWVITNANPVAIADSNGVIRLDGNASNSCQLYPNDSSTQLPWVQSKNPTVIVNCAQAASGAGTRHIGFVDSTILNGADPTNGIFFRHTAGGNIYLVCRSGGVESTQDLGTAAANGVFHNLKFVVNGTTSVTPYIDGVAKTAITAHIPTVSLYFAMDNGSATAGSGLDVDFVYISQTR